MSFNDRGFLFAGNLKSVFLRKIQSMQKFFTLISAVAVLSLSSCGGGDAKNENEGKDSTGVSENEDLDMSTMQEHDLSKAGLNAKIMVADEIASSGEHFPVKDSVILEGISWNVSVGETYNIIIEEAEGGGNYVDNEKKRLEGTGIYDLKYEVDKPNTILYEASLKNGAGSKPFYHVFGVVKIEGKDFIVKSNDAGDFNKGQAEKMLKTIVALQKQA